MKAQTKGPLAASADLVTVRGYRHSSSYVEGFAAACLTPLSERIRVGGLIGSNESSVLLSPDDARKYAEQILALCVKTRPTSEASK